MEDFGADLDPKTQSIIQGITGERQLSPIQKAESQATSVFTDLTTANLDFVKAINEQLRNSKDPFLSSSDIINCTVVGMASVLRAFDIETNYELISRFSNLNETDLHTAIRNISKFIASPSENILEQVLNDPRIPDQQINLNEYVNKIAGEYIGYNKGRYVNLGAGTMYSALGILWPKLFPQGHPGSSPQS